MQGNDARKAVAAAGQLGRETKPLPTNSTAGAGASASAWK